MRFYGVSYLWSEIITQVPTLSPAAADRFRDFERRRHDALSASYNDFFAPVTALANEPLLDAVCLSAGSRLLDVATGTGALAARAAARGARPVGVDLSSGMVDLARRLHPGLDYRVADVEHLPLPDRSVDAVVCSFALGHFPYPEAAVAECVRVLVPGGRIAFSWWDDPSRQRIQGLFREAIAEIGATPPPEVPVGHSVLRFSDTAEFRRLLEGAKLSEVDVADHRTSHLIRDVETLWRGGLGSLAVTAAAIEHQDDATRAAIRAALERRAAAYATPEGLRLPIAFKVGMGRKP